MFSYLTFGNSALEHCNYWDQWENERSLKTFSPHPCLIFLSQPSTNNKKNQVYLGSPLPSVDSGEDLLECIFFSAPLLQSITCIHSGYSNQDWKEWHLGSVTNSAHILDLNFNVRDSTSYNPTMIIFVKKIWPNIFILIKILTKHFSLTLGVLQVLFRF